MKSVFFMALMAVTTLSLGQSSADSNIDANSTANANALQSIAGGTLGGRQFTGTATFYNPKFDREGSVYLFDRWDHGARIYAKNNAGSFTAENMNFNAQRSMFESKRNDSIKGWNFANIEKIQVNGRAFKSYYFEPLKRHKIFEVVFEGDDFAILKGYTVRILDANPNPMLARLRDKVIKDETYYIDTPESLKEFKLKKKNILAALGEKAKPAEDYAKEYRLSFKKDDDLKKILNYVQRQ